MMANYENWVAKARRTGLMIVAACGVALAPAAALAQVQTVDPNTAIDADLAPPGGVVNPPPATSPSATPVYESVVTPTPQSGVTTVPAMPDPKGGYQKDDIVGAAEGVFGKGAEGLASMIEKIFKDQGKPNAYIAGREASGAVGVGLRYGSGTMTHKIEGERKVYWTGPSLGFDIGGNASKVFVLVYNLYDTQEIYRRYPQVEGSLYVIGGLTATYLRRGDIVLIPIRMGVGWRAGINAGYMKFSEKSRWFPF